MAVYERDINRQLHADFVLGNTLVNLWNFGFAFPSFIWKTTHVRSRCVDGFFPRVYKIGEIVSQKCANL